MSKNTKYMDSPLDGTEKKKLKPEIELLKTAMFENKKKATERASSKFPQVVGSSSSQLIYIAIDHVNYDLYCVDNDLMIRQWSLRSGRCLRSYLLETRSDQIKELNAGLEEDHDPANLKNQKKIQMAKSDRNKKFLMVCFEGGEIQVNNLYTGALIYNNYNLEAIKFENEVAQVEFFTSQTKFWIAASCFDGRVAFLTKPILSQGQSHLKYSNTESSHQRDVITMSLNSSNQLVTGSTDNVLCFWNSFSGVQSKKIILPDDVASEFRGQKITFIKYPFPSQRDLLLIILNTGECFFLET